MTTGIYKHKKHTKERSENISKALTGRIFSAEHRKHISEAQRGEKSNTWKGEDAVKISKHKYVASIKPKSEVCEFCGKKSRLALANMKDHNYTKDPNDYKWLCYSCHKKYDLKCAYCGTKEGKLRMRMVCPNCYTEGIEAWKKLFVRRLKSFIRKINYMGYVPARNPFSNYELNKMIINDLYKEINKLAGEKLI
jgi:hypothetical protein